MTRNKTHLFCIALAVQIGLLVLWLVFSNSLIGRIANKDVQLSASEVPKETNGSFVFYGVDDLLFADNLQASIEINGWAFSPDEKRNSNRKTLIMLKSNKGIYVFSTQNTARPDIQIIFKETKEPVPGFHTEFSTVALPQGVYQLGIYCYENAAISGQLFTPYYIQKSADGVAMWQSELTSLSGAPTGEAFGAVETVTSDENGLTQIRGWALSGVEKGAEGQKVILKITDKNRKVYYLTTLAYDRPDIAKAKESDNFLSSGFVANIPEDLLSLKEFEENQIEWIVQQEGKYYIMHFLQG